MLPEFTYVRPRTTAEAIEQLGVEGARIHAGGTDLLGCLRDGVFDVDRLVSLGGLDELNGIRFESDGSLRLGALTSIDAVATNDEIRMRFPGLAEAAGAVASPQLRNQGTLGGNLCQRPRCWYFRGEFPCAKKGGDRCYAVSGQNRYHAIFGGDPCYIVHPSDTAPMLVALDASVEILGPGGRRLEPLADFFVLPEDDLYRENILGPGELVTEVRVPPAPAGSTSRYRKARERGAWDFALASVAIMLRRQGETIEETRVVFGGVAPKPWRSTATEAALVGHRLDSQTIAAAGEAAIAGAEPLDYNGYKVPLLRGLVIETLTTLSAGA